MSDFFSRLIERTMGFAETVQPLAVPLYSTFSSDLPPLNNTNSELQISEGVREIKDNIVKQPLRINKNNESQNSTTKREEPIMDKSGYEREPVKSSSFLRKLDISETQKSIKGITQSSEIIDSDKTKEKKAEKKEASAEKSVTDILFPESEEFHYRGNSSTQKKFNHTEKSVPSLLPGSSKEGFSYERSGITAFVKHNVFDNKSKDQKSESIIPTVKVTIGRVEVRAVMQQAHKTKLREQAKPKLTLDDYLRQRMEGKR
jgi:hypothetical protein